MGDDPLLRDPQVQNVRAAVLTALRETLDGLDPETTVLVLSGGLDTSIIAAAVGAGDSGTRFRFRHAVTVTVEGGEGADLPHARAVAAAHGLQLDEVLVGRGVLQGGEAVRRCVAALQTFDAMELRGGAALAAALAHAQARGFGAAVLGDAADELFAGYGFLAALPPPRLRAWLRRIAPHMAFAATPLAAALGAPPLAVVQPFAHPAVVNAARACAHRHLLGRNPADPARAVHGKFVLRCAFPEAVSRWREKLPLETGVGTTALARAFDAAVSDADFALAVDRVYATHGIVIRDKEHLHYFRLFESLFARPADASQTGTGNSDDASPSLAPDLERFAVPKSNIEWTIKAPRFGSDPCIKCGFQLERKDQYFCKTCGAWPARHGGIPEDPEEPDELFDE